MISISQSIGSKLGKAAAVFQRMWLLVNIHNVPIKRSPQNK